MAYGRQLEDEKRFEEAIKCYTHILRNIDYSHDEARQALINIFKDQGKPLGKLGMKLNGELVEPPLGPDVIGVEPLNGELVEPLNVALQLEGVRIFLNPYNTQPFINRALWYEGTKNYREALTQIQAALKVCPEDYILMELAGKYLRYLGQNEAAIKVWEKTLEINPSYVWLQRYLEFVQSLGPDYIGVEPQNKTAFYQPFSIALETLLAETLKERTRIKREEGFDNGSVPITSGSRDCSPPSLSRGFDEYYLLDQIVTKVNKDGTRRQYVHQVIQILNERSVRSFDNYNIPYNPLSQRAKVLNARVIHPDGTYEEARISGNRAIEFPPLAIDDIVQLEYRIEDTGKSFFGDYFGEVFYFASHNPVYRANYTLIAPHEKPLYFNQSLGPDYIGVEPLNGELVEPRNPAIRRSEALEWRRTALAGPKVTKDENTVIYEWTMNNLTPIAIGEPLMPSLDEVAPVLEISSYKDWKEFGRWYWHLIQRQYDINDEMKFMLKRLIHPDMSEPDKIRLIYTFVTGEIRYEAWEYGIHGWKPYTASTIFTRRFGDCKDKALLINTLLRELGIESYPVLVYATDTAQGRSKEDLTLPMVEHFNHCITYARTKEGQEFWLDGTASFTPMGKIPAMDNGATVFIINQEGGELRQIPQHTVYDNTRVEMLTVRIDVQGNALCKMSATIHGEQAASLRYYLATPGNRELYLERVFGSSFGGAQVIESWFSPLEDLEVPVSYKLTVALPGFLQPREKEFAFRATPFPLKLSRLASQAERKFDILLPSEQYPCTDEVAIEYILPEKSRVKSLPDNLELKSRFGTYIASYQQQENKITLNKKLVISAMRINQKDYQEFRDFCNRVTAQEEKEIIITFPE